MILLHKVHLVLFTNLPFAFALISCPKFCRQNRWIPNTNLYNILATLVLPHPSLKSTSVNYVQYRRNTKPIFGTLCLCLVTDH